MIYKCNRCGNIGRHADYNTFEQWDDMIFSYDDLTGAWDMYCSKCGSDYFTEGVECRRCHDFAEYELCDNCAKELYIQIRALENEYQIDTLAEYV